MNIRALNPSAGTKKPSGCPLKQTIRKKVKKLNPNETNKQKNLKTAQKKAHSNQAGLRPKTVKDNSDVNIIEFSQIQSQIDNENRNREQLAIEMSLKDKNELTQKNNQNQKTLNLVENYQQLLTKFKSMTKESENLKKKLSAYASQKIELEKVKNSNQEFISNLIEEHEIEVAKIHQSYKKEMTILTQKHKSEIERTSPKEKVPKDSALNKPRIIINPPTIISERTLRKKEDSIGPQVVSIEVQTDLNPSNKTKANVQNKKVQVELDSEVMPAEKERKELEDSKNEENGLLEKQNIELEAVKEKLKLSHRNQVEKSTLDLLKQRVSAEIAKFKTKRSQNDLLLSQQEGEIENNKRLIKKIKEAINVTEGPRLIEIQKKLRIANEELIHTQNKLRKAKDSLGKGTSLEGLTKEQTQETQKLKDSYEATIKTLKSENAQMKLRQSELEEKFMMKEATLQKDIEALRTVNSEYVTKLKILEVELSDITERRDKMITFLEEKLKREKSHVNKLRNLLEAEGIAEPEKDKMPAEMSGLEDQFSELSTIIENSGLLEQSGSMVSAGLFDDNLKSLRYELMNMKEKYQRSKDKVQSLQAQLNESNAFFMFLTF